MSLHKHEPVPEELMEAQSPVNSICETLRMIYHKTDDPEIKMQCRIATSMAKSMSKYICKLTGNEAWFKGYWDKKEV